MKYAIGILNWIKANRGLSFLLIGLLTFSISVIFRAKQKTICEDCTPFKDQNRELISALIDIKKDLQAGVTTSYMPERELIFFAVDTTTPVQKVLSKIDSILLKIKQDSIKRAIQQKSKT